MRKGEIISPVLVELHRAHHQSQQINPGEESLLFYVNSHDQIDPQLFEKIKEASKEKTGFFILAEDRDIVYQTRKIAESFLKKGMMVTEFDQDKLPHNGHTRYAGGFKIQTIK
jgi:hypothetical protein